MAFSNTLSQLRMLGRRIVLPSGKIKKILLDTLKPTQNDCILDLGAGTLYWSKWLYENYRIPILAVDTYYKEASETRRNGNFRLYRDYFECVQENKVTILWMCDVMHHLDRDFRRKLRESVEKEDYRWIVVKDIDCRRKVGNFMNRIHDRIINGEKIYNVNPERLELFLKERGYKIRYYFIPKLWYPHFLLIGEKL